MQLDLDDEETRALLNVLMDAIEDDRWPLSPRVQLLRGILMKFGEMEGVAPELAEKLRRYASPPPAPLPRPKPYAPPTKGRYRKRR
jgi:hypothetical protein